MPLQQLQPTVPRALDRVVRKCLQKRPADHWHSAYDFKQTLELIDVAGPPTYRPQAPTACRLPSSRHPDASDSIDAKPNEQSTQRLLASDRQASYAPHRAAQGI